jgi:predicted nucleic acid-binding protein
VSQAFGARKLVVDNSAFQRGGQQAVRGQWLQALQGGLLYRTPILEFEVLYSARNAREHAELAEELEALRPLELSPEIIASALHAQSELAQHAPGFHRLPHQDYLIAAAAAAHDLGVLHYDGDFDRIAQHSSLAFESIWIAAAGTLDRRAPDPLRAHRTAVSHGLAQLSGARAEEVLEAVFDLIQRELRADGLDPPARPRPTPAPKPSSKQSKPRKPDAAGSRPHRAQHPG